MQASRDGGPPRAKDAYRDYGAAVRPGVAEFYRANHTHQTLDFVRQKIEQYAPGKHGRMGVWEAMELLDTLVDDSDPDTQVSQLQHLLQTAEAIRRDGHPRWFVLTGLVHDLGKILCLHGEPQWAAVGDTFPVGCRFSDKIVFPEFFADNPDVPAARADDRHRDVPGRAAASTTCCCPGGTTSSCTGWPAPTCPPRGWP